MTEHGPVDPTACPNCKHPLPFNRPSLCPNCHYALLLDRHDDPTEAMSRTGLHQPTAKKPVVQDEPEEAPTLVVVPGPAPEEEQICRICHQANPASQLRCTRCAHDLQERSAPPPPPPPPEPPARPGRRPLFAVLAVVAVAVVAALVTLLVVRDSTHPGGPSPSPSAPSQSVADPAQQAAALDGVLAQSAQGRKLVSGALDDLDRCARVAGARTDLAKAITLREDAIDQVDATDLSALPKPDVLRARLIGLLRLSVKADESYLAWAKTDSPCRNRSGNTDHQRATAFSNRASPAKERFLSDWNPVAKKYGLKARGTDGI